MPIVTTTFSQEEMDSIEYMLENMDIELGCIVIRTDDEEVLSLLKILSSYQYQLSKKLGFEGSR